VFLAERRLIVGFLGMGAVSLNRPAMIDQAGTGNRHPARGSYRNPVFKELRYAARLFPVLR
jgi:hypothetical protein